MASDHAIGDNGIGSKIAFGGDFIKSRFPSQIVPLILSLVHIFFRRCEVSFPLFEKLIFLEFYVDFQ